ASVGGLLSLASQISLFLVTTITTVSTAPESIKKLRQEFSSLCVALASLEKALSVDHIARRPDFPKEDLSDVLSCMMGDFIVLQGALGKLVPGPTDSKMKILRKRLAWAFLHHTHYGNNCFLDDDECDVKQCLRPENSVT
ncbi:uncharacterized protein H6S33_007016, partial [Morchella sextelata]|uniref:uncharacterized protein n=1 Tax=Morchella sextelata TaxID=1174677 RepID=UPI001D03DBB4